MGNETKERLPAADEAGDQPQAGAVVRRGQLPEQK